MLEWIVNLLEEKTGLPVKPFGIDSLDECIIFNTVPQTNDGIIETWRLELRLITDTLLRAEELKKLITNTLCTVGDNPNGEMLDCHLNGGGSLKDPNGTIHSIMYFYITNKVRR